MSVESLTPASAGSAADLDFFLDVSGEVWISLDRDELGPDGRALNKLSRLVMG